MQHNIHFCNCLDASNGPTSPPLPKQCCDKQTVFRTGCLKYSIARGRGRKGDSFSRTVLSVPRLLTSIVGL